MGKRSSVFVEIEVSEKEQAFIDNISRGILPTQAAILAGWSGPQAARALTKKHIQALLRKGLKNLQAVVARIDREAAEAGTDDEAEAA